MSKNMNKKKPAVKIKKEMDFPVSLSLLSAFCEDIVPPLPIVLLTDKEVAERNRMENSRTRGRNHKIRQFSDDE
jgi:hypothetical protein